MNSRVNRDYKTEYSKTERFLMAVGAVTLSFMAVLFIDYVARLGA